MELQIVECLKKRNEKYPDNRMTTTDLAELVIEPTKTDDKLERREVRWRRYKALRRLIRGEKQNINPNMVEKLCVALEVSPNQLFNYSPKKLANENHKENS